MNTRFANKYEKALMLCLTAKLAGEVLNYEVTKDSRGYRYIMAETDGGWSEWFNEAMEDEFSDEYRDSWMHRGCDA